MGLNHNLYHTERTFKKRKNQTKGAFWAKKCKERDLTKWFNDEEISSCSCCINEVKKILGLIWVTGDGELYDTDPTDVKLIELVIFLIVNLTF